MRGGKVSALVITLLMTPPSPHTPLLLALFIPHVFSIQIYELETNQLTVVLDCRQMAFSILLVFLSLFYAKYMGPILA